MQQAPLDMQQVPLGACNRHPVYFSGFGELLASNCLLPIGRVSQLLSSLGTICTPSGIIPATMTDQVRQVSLEQAKQFYQIDKGLTPADRADLATAFLRQNNISTAAQFGCMVGVFAGPVVLQRFKLTKRPVSPILLTIATVVGLWGSGVAGNELGYALNRGRLADREGPLRALDLMHNYPPNIAAAYYARTAKKPEYIMPDPAKINWSQEPLFPLNLVAHGEKASRAPREAAGTGPSGTVGASRADPVVSGSQPVSGAVDEDDPFGDNKTPGRQTYQNAWDRIRQEQGVASPQPRWSAPASNASASSPDPFAADSIANNGGFGSDEIDAPAVDTVAQAQFDKELERERSGVDATTDDFSESEKKWSSR